VTVLRQQRLMITRFDDLTGAHDQDEIGAHGSRKAMGNDDGCATAHEFMKAVQPLCLGPRIHGAGRLIQENNAGLAQKGARQSNALPLAATKTRAIDKPFSQQCVIPLG